MIEIKEKTIIYTLEANNLDGLNPYLFVERLAEEILNVWSFIEVKKVFSSKKHSRLQIYCHLPSHYSKEQIKLIKIQIELLASNLLVELKDKLFFAGLAS